jgi:DNA anti-recombination protein RmuC
MAEIHILPAHLSGLDQTARLGADLLAAHAQGVDLGSRAAHIHAHGEALQSLSRDLDDAFGVLRETLGQLGMQDQHAQDMLNQLLSRVRELADSASRYPSEVMKG